MESIEQHMLKLFKISTQRFKPAGMLCTVNWPIFTKVSDDSISLTFRVKKLDYDPSKHC
jgi:hypothetical protein